MNSVSKIFCFVLQCADFLDDLLDQSALKALGSGAGAVLKQTGADALGEVKVKINSNNGSFTGRGVSTDVIKASIKAYVNAINKWTKAKV